MKLQIADCKAQTVTLKTQLAAAEQRLSDNISTTYDSLKANFSQTIFQVHITCSLLSRSACCMAHAGHASDG